MYPVDADDDQVLVLGDDEDLAICACNLLYVLSNRFRAQRHSNCSPINISRSGNIQSLATKRLAATRLDGRLRASPVTHD